MNRRRFLWNATLATLGATESMHSSVAAGRTPFPILDTHIHLFDPTRPGGVPWPLPNDPIYKPTLPARYESIAAPFGVVGAIAVEASPLASDNDWVLNVVGASPIMVGMVGDLIPTRPDFALEVERLHRNPLFLGIRHGNLWNRDLSADLDAPAFHAALQQLAAANLVFESANPDPKLLAALVKIANRHPDLTIVVDHLPHMEEPATASTRAEVSDLLRELGSAHRVYAKLSEIPSLANGKPGLKIQPYRDRLDHLWDIFGPDRLMFGSDWPNSDHIATFGQTLALTRDFLATKTEDGARKVFFTNSRKIYRWKPRRPTQVLAT